MFDYAYTNGHHFTHGQCGHELGREKGADGRFGTEKAFHRFRIMLTSTQK